MGGLSGILGSGANLGGGILGLLSRLGGDKKGGTSPDVAAPNNRPAVLGTGLGSIGTSSVPSLSTGGFV